MILVLTAIFFVFGLIIGSFLNVVILRLNTKRSLRGRSSCLSCQKGLLWYELVPIVSFFTLRGRCKSCKTKISIQYPLVEFATGLIFAALFFKFQDIFFINTLIFLFAYVYYAFLFSLLIVIATYDFRHKIIPDTLSFVFGIFSFVGLFYFSNNYGFLNFYPHLPSVLDFSSGLLLASPFALFWLISKGAWMGLGDAKLALGVGWLLSFFMALSALVVAFWSGAVVGLILVIFSKKYGMKSEIPFAPYLVFGAFVAFILELNLFHL